MRVDDRFLEQAVLNIFATSVYGHSDVPAEPGRFLGLSDLREEWRGCHLRHDDLDAALQRMLASGHLQRQNIEGADSYALTALGLSQRLDPGTRSPLRLWNQLRGLIKLTSSQARKPAQGAGEPTPHRRRSDRTDGPSTDGKPA